MIEALRTVLTEDRANQVWDPLRIAFLVAFAIGMILQTYDVLMGRGFSIVNFGVGVGSLLAGTGAALWTSSHQKDS